MKFTVITLFPEMVECFLKEGLIAQARQGGRIQVDTLNPRRFTRDIHQTVDDRVFGGSDGMVMKPEPLAEAIRSLKTETPAPTRVVVLSPQGRLWTQKSAREWSDLGGHVVLVSGRYAGIDQRFIQAYADEEISIGDYVLNGGELAACVLIESVGRLRPGVLGNAASAVYDSFENGRLECPQFTRPREFEGFKVPEVLTSGHHERIARFQDHVSWVRTAWLRPDLKPDPQAVKNACRALETLDEAELNVLGLSHQILKDLE